MVHSPKLIRDFMNRGRLLDGKRVTFDCHEHLREFCDPMVVVGNRRLLYCSAAIEYPGLHMGLEEFALLRKSKRFPFPGPGDQGPHRLTNGRQVIFVYVYARLTCET